MRHIEQRMDGLVQWDSKLRPLVEAAMKQLDEESKGTTLSTSATWGNEEHSSQVLDPTSDTAESPTWVSWYMGELVDGLPADPPAVWVTVKDDTGETHGRIALSDLAEPLRRRRAIIRFWGQVLANRSERLMRQRMASAGVDG